MQNINETKNKVELEQLNLQLAEIEAERERIQKQLQALKPSLTKTSSTGLWSRATLAAVSILAVASLLSTSVFHYAQSNVKQNDQPEVSAISALEPGQIPTAEHQPSGIKKTSSRSGKKTPFFARQRQRVNSNRGRCW